MHDLFEENVFDRFFRFLHMNHKQEEALHFLQLEKKKVQKMFMTSNIWYVLL